MSYPLCYALNQEMKIELHLSVAGVSSRMGWKWRWISEANLISWAGVSTRSSRCASHGQSKPVGRVAAGRTPRFNAKGAEGVFSTPPAEDSATSAVKIGSECNFPKFAVMPTAISRNEPVHSLRQIAGNYGKLRQITGKRPSGGFLARLLCALIPFNPNN